MSECRERLNKILARLGKTTGTDYIVLMEWNRVKRLLAEAAAECIKKKLGDRIVDIYYADLSGGEPAEVGGRDVDLIVVVRKGVNATKLAETLERELNSLVPLDKVAGFTGGKNLFEIHVVVEGSEGYASSIARSRYSPPTRL